METPYAVAPQERRDWQGASRIMELAPICESKLMRSPYAVFLQENKQGAVRLGRNSRTMEPVQFKK